MFELDVRGLSCPEPVLLTMDAIDDHKGESIKVIANEAHTRKNIERALSHEKIAYESTTENGDFVITFNA